MTSQQAASDQQSYESCFSNTEVWSVTGCSWADQRRLKVSEAPLRSGRAKTSMLHANISAYTVEFPSHEADDVALQGI